MDERSKWPPSVKEAVGFRQGGAGVHPECGECSYVRFGGKCES